MPAENNECHRFDQSKQQGAASTIGRRMNTQLFNPMIAMLFLTFIVFLRLFFFRFTESKAKRIHPQKMATPEGVAAVMSDRAMAASHCFKNLLEMPIIFYVSCLMITLSNQTDQLYLLLAWVFVFFRLLQAFIHCTYNNVLHRFMTFVTGSLVAWAITFRFAISQL